MMRTKLHPKIVISSDDYSNNSNDLPDVSTPRAYDVNYIMSDSSSEDYSYESEAAEIDWNSKNKPRNKSYHPAVSTPSQIQIKNKIVTPHHPKLKQEIQKKAIEENSTGEFKLNNDDNQIKEINKEPIKTKQSNPENENLISNSISTENQHNDIQTDTTIKKVEEQQIFQVFYGHKNLKKIWKRQIQMTKEGTLLYICDSFKFKEYGKTHVICTKPPVNINSQHFCGMIIRHQSGTRFTLYGKKDNEITNPQLAGISFITNDNDHKIRMFRVAVPDASFPYFPSNKQEDLSRIAQKGVNVPNVKIFSTQLPVKEKGVFRLYFGGAYDVISSTKNFVIYDDGTQALAFFKIFDGMCTLKIGKQFSNLIGFAIAVAISTSPK